MNHQPIIHPLVKAIALTVFILLPFIGFYTGIRYQQSVSTTNQLAPIMQPLISAQPLVHRNTAQPAPLPTADPLAGWQTYTNSQYHFSLQYPSTFQPVFAEQPYFFRATPLFAVRKTENNDQTMRYTQDSTIAVSVDQNTTTCGLDPRDQSVIRGLTVLNGTNFFMGGTGGAAVGNHYTSVFYRTTQDKTCIEITTTVHVSTDGNSVSPTQETQLVDQAKEELARIVDTVKLVDEERIKKEVSAQLPAGSLLRDIELLTDTAVESYMVLYVEKGYRFENFDYDSCPGTILGQALIGTYHLALYQNDKLMSDLVIPPAYTSPAQLLPLAYQNTRRNLYPTSTYTEQEKNTVETVKLLKLADYTGDGKPYEVLLTTTFGGCGFYDRLAAGYDKSSNSIVFYSGWLHRFNPDTNGNAHYLFECGDHGNSIRVEEQYAFDTASKKFKKVWEKSTPCQNQ